MNAVEIAEAVEDLARAPFDRQEFPFAFLTAFGNKETTVKRLRSASANASDVPGGVLQRNNIHIATCDEGQVNATLAALRASPKTIGNKAKFILATDGAMLEAEDLASGETIACDYPAVADKFGFFLPLAGISTVRQIKNNPIDVKATGRLNKLYVELLKDNPDWGTEARRHDLNQFMARLIFCFFAEDTGIFFGGNLFTATVEQMSDSRAGNTHDVIATLFRAMDTKIADRPAAKLPTWADAFPYVNGGLFAGAPDCPKFSRIARTYLLRAGELSWRDINPDIFGSMIQAVAEDEERGALGMHYTSVPNILKVLNPLFLDDLRTKLEEAGDNSRTLLNLRKRIARIRVFDPACGSGNFLVIAYKQMREIEAAINQRRGEPERRSDIPLTNFRGIELRDFPAEIARLALIIARYQCDVIHRGQKEALREFLPLDAMNWITCGNALRLDWLSVCRPEGTSVKLHADDLFNSPLDQAQIDFENEGGETYICGNPPYFGSRRQQDEQKSDLKALASLHIPKWKSLDYVAGWLLKAAEVSKIYPCRFAFVCTSSIAEGLQVAILWPRVLGQEHEVYFAHRPFKWANLAKSNAGVTVVIVGIKPVSERATLKIYDGDRQQLVEMINPYLVPAPTVYVETEPNPLAALPRMVMGSMPRDGGHLLLDQASAREVLRIAPRAMEWVRRYVGSDELINGLERYCLWIKDDEADEVRKVDDLSKRLKAVSKMRQASPLASTNEFADRPHRFVYLGGESRERTVAVGGVSSEKRSYLPVDVFDPKVIVSNATFAIYDGPIWTFSVIASRLHLAWVASVCGKLEARYRYSNTLGWHTFPVPILTDKNKGDLTRCAEDILLAREAHFPATIADLYDPEGMPDNLRHAHDKNDETLERIYIGRRFRNDTERLEKLFDLYTKMTADKPARKGAT